MDQTIARWTWEFLLRQKLDIDIIKRLVEVVPVHEDLMKLILLTKISSDVSFSSINESTLDNLEMIQKFDIKHGNTVLDSLSEAYHDVAVHCTVSCLKDNSADLSDYLNSVYRIWRHKIERFKNDGLVHDRFSHTRDKIEKALWKPTVRQELLCADTLGSALNSVRVFLADEEKHSGETFLQVAFKGFSVSGEELNLPSNLAKDGNARSLDDISKDALTNDGREPHLSPSNAIADQTEVGNLPLSNGCEKVIDANNERGVHLSLSNVLADQAQKRKVCSAGVPCEDLDVNDDEEVHNSHDILQSDQAEKKKASSSGRAPEVYNLHIDDHTASGSHAEIQCEANVKHNLVTTPEVRKILKVLESSLLDLREVVKDPLPEALNIAATITERIAIEALENQGVVEQDVCIPVVDERDKAVVADEANTSNQIAGTRPSLMVRNNTARTFEWDEDSVDESNERLSKRRRLPAYNETPISVLVKYDFDKKPRRKKKRWSALEEQALRDAVREHGQGNWRLILDRCHDKFDERTVVDLKDKWRNMMR